MEIDRPIDANEYMKAFKKSFHKVYTRLPIRVNYAVYSTGVTIYRVEGEKAEKVKAFPFDFSLSVKESIADILAYLAENEYPVMEGTNLIEVPGTPKEVNALVEQGKVSLKDVSPRGYYTTSTSLWRPEKIFLNNDTVIVRCLTDNTRHLFRSKVPVSVLMRRVISESSKNSTTIWAEFCRKTKYLKKLQ